MTMSRMQYVTIFEMAREYLLSFAEIDEEILDRHLKAGENKKMLSMNDVMKAMLNSIQNRGGMPNTIGELENIREPLFGFNPYRVTESYGQDYRSCWEKLFNEIKASEKITREMKSKKNSYWVVFCKSAISVSSFLSRFSSIEDFNKFVGLLYVNEYTRPVLPLLLAKEIYGLGFVLACDFLKENGYPEYVKPDRHIKAIFNGVGISGSEDDYEVFRAVITFSKIVGRTPYEVDKLFWLVGSGRFYLEEPEIHIGTKRDDFVKSVNNKLSASENPTNITKTLS